MKVAVLGLWHLGSVVAACTAAAGHRVAGWDPDPRVVQDLNAAQPPIAEPGLAALVRSGLDAGTLTFVPDRAHALVDAAVIWIAFDTPVDDADRADVEFVVNQVENAFSDFRDGALVLVSSQLPIGTVARLERSWQQVAGTRRVSFAYSPENLRLGGALDVFNNPDRIVIGVRSADDRARVEMLFAPITTRLEWMTVESAEMTKHAINAFLATSVTFINELAGLCDRTGADVKDVERGLKTDRRIGRAAYLSPGAAFAGGTLARDLVFLKDLGDRAGAATLVIDAVDSANTLHRQWPQQRLLNELGSLKGKTIAVWGLTYKPGTDTVRRSTAVELCRWALDQGSTVAVHDPAVKEIPASIVAVRRCATPLAAATGADALVVATEWPDYRGVDAESLAAAMPSGLVIDANRFLQPVIGHDARFRLMSVGQVVRPFGASNV